MKKDREANEGQLVPLAQRVKCTNSWYFLNYVCYAYVMFLGEKGSKGVQGIVGPPGRNGDNGRNGIPGPRGKSLC